MRFTNPSTTAATALPCSGCAERACTRCGQLMAAAFCAGFIEKLSSSLKDFDEGSKEMSLDDWNFLDIKSGL